MLDAKTKFIAVCSAGIDLDYNESLWKAIHSLADLFGFKILYFNSFSSLFDFEKHDVGESNIFHLINYNLIDGIILLSETIKNEGVRNEIIERANIYDVPVVSIDSRIEGCFNIAFQYENAMEKIVSHLVEDHGYERINFIAGIEGNRFSEERLEAYKAVLEKHGIPYEEERVGYGGFWDRPTKDVIDKFIASDLPFPQAIVCANDSMALAAFRYLDQAGYKVPEDVAVTGFDGIREAIEHYPSITTACHDYYSAILQSFRVLEGYFAGKNPPEVVEVDSVLSFGASCGCEDHKQKKYSALTRELYEQIAENDSFNRNQIALSADLTDNDSFQGIFDNLMKYAENFCANKFWLCIVDDFLSEKEVLADIIEETTFKRVGYSTTMDIMLARMDGQWQGITDFHTASLLPNMEEVLEEENNLMFLPLHVLEQTIGYVALVYEPKLMNMNYAYRFFMNISNALETTKIHLRQQAIINNLEIKYVHDPMTGLFNRRGFYDRMESIYETCITENRMIMVVSVDLNGLKQINDTYGHADGDIAISTIGKALAHVSKDSKTCARFGGDEFVAAGIVENEQEASAYCKEVEQYLEEFNKTSGKPYTVCASIGYVTGMPNTQISLDEFIKVADEKMYQEKVRYHAARK